MAITIVPHGPEHVEAIRAFNLRMREGGTKWGWYEDPVPSWIPPSPGQRVWREYYVAIEDKDTVRGAYALKPQEWWVNGRTTLVTDWQGPFSEGAYDRKYNMLGLRLLRDMLKKRPLLYSWGHGGYEESLPKMLRSLNWLMHDTPFCLRILHPQAFLRKNAYLRRDVRQRLALDLLANTGLGWLGTKALFFALSASRPRLRRAKTVREEAVSTFGGWADELWHRCREAYRAIAIRDAATMNVLVPDKGWPPGLRLKVSRNGALVGWAVVMDTQMSGDGRFGDLRVGSIVDCFALPEGAGDVIASAVRFLTERGVDIIVSNQSHPAWIEAFAGSGFVVLRRRRIFAASPDLQRALEPFDETKRGLHLTNMDGHGPHAM